MKRLVSLFFICLLLFSCKDDTGPSISDIPILRVESISPATVVEFRDSIILVLSYEDQNGDLGSEDPDEKTLWVKDSRLPLADLYHVKPLAPVGEDIPIKGTLEVGIRSAFLLGNGTSEQVAFTVRIKDRAGNWSEEETSASVTVTR